MLPAADGVIVAGTSAGLAGDPDYLVIKYAANGDQAWTYRHDSFEGAKDELRGLAIDPAGNVFATGTTDTVKLNSSGALVWNVPLPGRAVAATTNFVYVTGSSDLDYSTTQLENNDVDGKESWTRVYDGPAKLRDISSVIAVAENGEAVIGGSQTFATTRLSTTIVLSVIRYTTNGSHRWHGTGTQYPIFGNGAFTSVRDITFDQADSVYIIAHVGSFTPIERFNTNGTNTLSTGSGTGTMWAIKPTPDGNYVYAAGEQAALVVKGLAAGGVAWARGYGNEGAEGRDVVVASNGDIYVTGFDPQAATGHDMFLLKYTATGSLAGSIVYDSPQHGHDVANAMVRDAAGNIYVTGYSTTPEGGTEFLTLKYSIGPKIEQKPSGVMYLEFHTLPGRQYLIEGTTNFLDWQNLITANADANGIVQFDDINAPTIPYRFYRGSYFP